jgi:UDP-N-acetylenolpyruvoylglucosamine reductase
MTSVQRPRDVAEDYPLARLTTIRTGGRGDFFARPHTDETLAELLAWAAAEGIEVGVVGSGSNLLIADAGFRGLVMKLDGSLSTIEQDGERLLCGGGARLPQAAAFAARAGLTGLEFGVNIPGTVGGAVKMNANAYGGDLARVLEWVEITTPSGTDRREPADLGFQYRRSNLRPAEIVARASQASRPSAPPSRTPTTRARRARAPASCSTRPAAAASASGALASRRSTPTSWRTWATPPPPT